MSSKGTCAGQRQPLVAGYANYFEVGHNAYEFLIDFGQIDPRSGEVNTNSRLALGPTHAKLFTRLLNGAIAKFEEEYGEIEQVRDEDPLGTVLDPSPDFERRAIDARRKSTRNSAPPEHSNQSKKR
jgi:hypothetical protein